MQRRQLGGRAEPACLVIGGRGATSFYRLDDLHERQLFGSRGEPEPSADAANTLKDASPDQFVEHFGNGMARGGGAGDEIVDAAVPVLREGRQPQDS